MSNPIKYSTGTENLALKKGNFYIGTGDVGKGPSDVTGFYQGPNVPSGGYVIYMNREGAPGNLSYHTATNDSELIAFTNNLAGQSYTTVNECLVYYAGQTDKLCVNRDYEGIVTDGLILNLDAGFTPSFPKSGVTWYDISGNNNNTTLVNGPTFNTDGGGCIVFDGVDDYNGLSNFSVPNDEFTFSGWIIPATIGNTYSILVIKNYHFTISFHRNSNIFKFTTNSNLGYESLDSLPSENFDNNWNYVTITYKNNGSDFTKEIYVNGGFYNTNQATNINVAGTVTGLYFGSSLAANIYGNTSVSIGKIYNRVLTSDEIIQNYNAQKGRFGL